MKRVAMVVAFLVTGVGGYCLGIWRTGRGIAEAKFAPIISETNKAIPGIFGARARVEAAQRKGPALVAAASAVDRGYAAAELGLDEALALVDSLPVSERSGFVAGIFSFAARNISPSDGLRLSQKLSPELKQTAWRTLVGEWIYARSPSEENKRSQMRDEAFTASGGRQGLLVELSSRLAAAKLDPELTAAWLDAFSDGTARSEMLATMAGAFSRANPDAFLKRMDNWTAWEKERVSRRFLSDWAYENPQEAWSWYQNERGRFDGDLSSSIFMAWANKEPDSAQKFLESVRDPAQREALVNIIGRTMGIKNTDAAVAWADGLADAHEREIAHKGIYDGAPHGVGAVLDYYEGFPTLRGVVPGSPLDGSGIQPGDRLVELRESDGSRQPLYGVDLQTAVNSIRGEPGSQMTLRILRKNGDSGAFEEHMIPVTRAQLYLDEKRIPKPN